MRQMELLYYRLFRQFVYFSLIFCCIVFFTVRVNAQSEDSPSKKSFAIEYDKEKDTKEKDKEPAVIIITADRIEKTLTDIPLSASVIDDKTIEENVFISMADLLAHSPGFSQIYQHHSPLLLRGSTTSKMLMLKNGNRLLGSMPQGFMGQNMNVYDIDRVEIIRGPGSVIYGSGANTAIVNIIDRDIFEDKGVNVRLGGAYGSNNMERMSLAWFHWNAGQFAMQLSGRYRKSDNMHYGGWEEAENSFYEDKDAVLKGGYKFNQNNKIIIESSVHYGGPWGKPLGFNDKPEDKKNMQANNENDNTYHFAGYYYGEKVGIFENISFSAYYDYETRDYIKKKFTTAGNPSNTTTVEYEDKYGGGHILGTIRLGQHLVSLGSDGYIFRIWSPETVENHLNGITTESDGVQKAGVSSIGGFVQDRWDIVSAFHLIGGVRYDWAEIDEGDNPIGDHSRSKELGAVSGNAGLIYNPTSSSAITLNLGRAFRIPDALDMYYERVTCGGTVTGNPDLEPEYSWNVDLGYRGTHKGFEWDLALFSNYYYNLIVKVPTVDGQTMDNREKARIMGGEAVASYTFKDLFAEGMHLRPGVSVSGYRGDDFTEKGNAWDISSSGEPIYGVPPLRVKGCIRYIIIGDAYNYFFEVDADHSMKKLRLPDEESELPWSNEDIDPSTLYGITTGIILYDLAGFESLKLNIRVQNLLDEQYYPYGSYIYGMGRNVKVFLSAEF